MEQRRRKSVKRITLTETVFHEACNRYKYLKLIFEYFKNIG